MPLDEKGDFDSAAHLPENYYIASLGEIRAYKRDSDDDALGMIVNFVVEHEGEEHEIPFFCPAKLSVSTDAESSRLAENLKKIGMLEDVLEHLGCKDEVMSETHKWYAKESDDPSDDPNENPEFENLETALRGALAGFQIRVDVEDQQDGESSQVGKLSKVFDPDEGGE